MALSPKRIIEGGKTDYPWEEQAIQFVLNELPDSDPHLAWPLQELMSPGTSGSHEIDMLVLARSALFVIEIKSHPGVLTGDALDWVFTEPGGRRHFMSSPYRETNLKAKVLASILDRKCQRKRPFVQPLIFLSNKEVEVRLSGGCPDYLVTRQNVRRTLVHGMKSGPPKVVVNRPMMREIRDVFHEIGLRPRRADKIVGGFKLLKREDFTDAYVEDFAENQKVKGDTARIRSYLVPKATSTERRQQLDRAAQREAQILHKLGHHPNILSYRTFVDDGPMGPAIIFEGFEGALPLDVFLKKEPELSFDERLHILQCIVEAIDFCHRNDYLHRNLSPASVLVRRNPADDRLEVKIHRFQTASQNAHTSLGTQHIDQLAEKKDQLYRAPEVLRDPRKAKTTSDVFSIGCLAWLLFTGQRPAPALPDREKRIVRDQGLRIAPVRGDLANLDEVIASATNPLESNRPANALEWFDVYLLERLTQPAGAEEVELDPYNAENGQQLAENLRVERVLGSGATARVLKVTRDGDDYALKVPHDEKCAQRLVQEGKVLERLHHQNIIRLHQTFELAGRYCLLCDFAGFEKRDIHYNSLAELLRAEGSLSLKDAQEYGSDLLSATQYLEEQDLIHRDIKPGNLGFTTQAKKKRHLVLYDFSLAAGEVTAIESGTPDWKDPWLHHRGRWDSHADRYAAACVLYRMLAGTRAELAEDGPDRGRVRIESERFDPAVRDRLREFFERCFAKDIADRFPSAEAMRHEWNRVLSERSKAPAAEKIASRGILESATPKTLVEALPLSSRARNALDRAGVQTVADLLRLPRNNLSAIRGIGLRVSQEIVEIASKLASIPTALARVNN